MKVFKASTACAKGLLSRSPINAPALLMALIAAIASTPTVTNASESTRFINVGTGSLNGVYHPLGEAVCRTMNQSLRETNIHCSASNTNGSISNLEALSTGEIDFGVIQSDDQHRAYHAGTIDNNKNLRTILSLHNEQFTIVTTPNAKISSFDDLQKKRVSISKSDTQHQSIMTSLMQLKGWSNQDFASMQALTLEQQAHALCDKKIDAYVVTIGHPALALKQAEYGCDIKVVGLSSSDTQTLIAQNSAYTNTVIPAGLYKGNEHDVATIGTTASLVASSDVEPEVVYELVKSVFKNIGAINKMHPAFKSLNTQSLLESNPSVPTHVGAIRFFSEQGLPLNNHFSPESIVVASNSIGG